MSKLKYNYFMVLTINISFLKTVNFPYLNDLFYRQISKPLIFFSNCTSGFINTIIDKNLWFVARKHQIVPKWRSA